MHRRLVVLMLGIIGAECAYACTPPVTPRFIPDGRKAGKEQMLLAKRTVDQYVQQVYEYMDCETDGRRLQDAKAMQKLVTERFNAEVRAFKAASQE